MITYLRNSLFDSPAQTLVNTVNTVGVMGKGIAKEFKERYPQMFSAYKKLCTSGELDIGKLQIWRDFDHWILNFPTKTTWKKPSKLEYIEAGLQTFVMSYKGMGISSVAFPPLGCGNGNLDWADVKPLMEHYLQRLEIPVYIHDRQVSLDFVPEHRETSVGDTPSSFEEFLADVRDTINAHSSRFRTITGRSEFSVKPLDEDNLLVEKANSSSKIRLEHLEWAWNALQSGILTFEQYPGDESRKAKSYLFAILAQLPYVKVAEVSRPEWRGLGQVHGLYFNRSSVMDGFAQATIAPSDEKQLCLYPEL